MVLVMHYSAVSVLEAYAPRSVREAVARGEHLGSLAFSESGTRSHFWAPMSTATADGDGVRLDARKSWVTSAGEADSYVWSSRPMAAPGPMTLWHVPADTPGVRIAGSFDGLGLRGNASKPVTAEGARVPRAAMLGEDGKGLDVALSVALPTFLVCNAAFSVGLADAMVAEAAAHLTATRLEHLDQTLAQQQVNRIEYARLRTRADEARAFLADTLRALADGARRRDAAGVAGQGGCRGSLVGGRRRRHEIVRRRGLPQRTRRRPALPGRARGPRDGPDDSGAARLRRPRGPRPAAAGPARRGSVQ
jgi:alkylation response protein AidB-like acyl-CoA dehydrogenase